MKLKVNSDERGELFEAFHFPNDGQVFCVKIAPNATRGNHFHCRKIEHFCVIDGDAMITLRSMGRKTRVPFMVSGNEPEVVKIKPRQAHNILAGDQGCTLLVWASEIFDENDSDTYKEVV